MKSRFGSMNLLRVASCTVMLGAIALAGTACGPKKYLTYEVWESPGQTSNAKKDWVSGIGGYHDEAWAALEKNDVDGTIKLIEGDANKGYFDWYNLAILYEVKHDWVKAEEAIQAAIKDHDEKFHKPYDMLQTELAYIQEHKARYVHTPAAAQ